MAPGFFKEPVMLGVVHTTEQKNSESHLRLLNEQLLQVARFQELSQVSAGIAHELNQPLTAMTNYAGVARHLLEAVPDEQGQRAFDAISKAADQAQRAAGIIRRMRGFVERRASDPQECDLNDVMEEAFAQGLIGTRGDSLKSHLHLMPDLPPVFVDRVQLQQVVFNLMRNALEAMADQRDAELVVSTQRKADEWVKILVADRGPGIADHVKDKLFRPFVTTKPGGMGIGLSISNSIVEAHGGKLSVATNPGGGTVFTIALPLLRAIP